jgi:hypothetical protein
MTEPLSLETILGELSDEDETWVLQDQLSGQYLTIPDDRFPGRRPIRFFLSRQNAESVLQEVLKVKQSLQKARITAVKVKTKQAIAFDSKGQYTWTCGCFCRSFSE